MKHGRGSVSQSYDHIATIDTRKARPLRAGRPPGVTRVKAPNGTGLLHLKMARAHAQQVADDVTLTGCKE